MLVEVVTIADVVAIVDLLGFVILQREDFELLVRLVVCLVFDLAISIQNFRREDFDLIHHLLECQIVVEHLELVLHFVDEALQF